MPTCNLSTSPRGRLRRVDVSRRGRARSTDHRAPRRPTNEPFPRPGVRTLAGRWTLMAIEVDTRLLEDMRLHSGGIHVVVQSNASPDVLQRGLQLVVDLIREIRHPEEPDEPY